jgi:hypothetical protein
MLRTAFVIISFVALPSCFLSKDYKRQEFTYIRTGDSSSSHVAVIVPKGFKHQERIADSLGHQGTAYQYKDGAEFYILYTTLGDNYQAFDTAGHIPQPHLQGGIFYKGIDSTKRWWREAQLPFFRIGYRYVNSEREVLFDSAVNYLKPGVSSHRKRK